MFQVFNWTVLFFFDYSREQLRQPISNLNAQKSKIKKSGIIVDGRKYNIKFTGKLHVKCMR